MSQNSPCQRYLLNLLPFKADLIHFFEVTKMTYSSAKFGSNPNQSKHVKERRLKYQAETQTFSDVDMGLPVAMHLDEVCDVEYELAQHLVRELQGESVASSYANIFRHFTRHLTVDHLKHICNF